MKAVVSRPDPPPPPPCMVTVTMTLRQAELIRLLVSSSVNDEVNRAIGDLQIALEKAGVIDATL